MVETNVFNLRKSDLSPGELMTISDVAAILQAKEKTIRQWVYQGKIPSIKLNGLLRFARSEIMTWIRSKIDGRQP